MFSSAPQVNIKQIARFWFTGEKIRDYPKCQMATGHLWEKAVIVGVLD